MPAPGAVVRLGERAVGTVTSVTRHHDYGPMALALLRRAVPVGEQLTVEITEVDEATGETIPAAAAPLAGLHFPSAISASRTAIPCCASASL